MLSLDTGGIYPLMLYSFTVSGTGGTEWSFCTLCIYPIMLKGCTLCFFAKTAGFWCGTGCICPAMIKGGAACFAAKRAGLGAVTGCLLPIVLTLPAGYKDKYSQNRNFCPS